MRINSIDILVIVIYLVATVLIGLVLKEVAQKDKSNYILGGNNFEFGTRNWKP